MSDTAHERVHVTGSELLAEEERKPVGKASVPGEHCGDLLGRTGRSQVHSKGSVRNAAEGAVASKLNPLSQL